MVYVVSWLSGKLRTFALLKCVRSATQLIQPLYRASIAYTAVDQIINNGHVQCPSEICNNMTSWKLIFGNENQQYYSENRSRAHCITFVSNCFY